MPDSFSISARKIVPTLVVEALPGPLLSAFGQLNLNWYRLGYTEAASLTRGSSLEGIP